MLSSDNDAVPAPGLPRLCYACHPETGVTVLIVRGEDGYHPIRTFLTPEQLNAVLTELPTAAQIRAMLVGSMFEWQVSGADPACQAAAMADAQPAVAEPRPLFPIVASWGGPDTPFRLMWRSPVRPGPSPGQDPLWAYAGQQLGLYGWLRVVDQHARQAFGRGLPDLPPRDWRGLYDNGVPPTEAADVAIDEHAARHGTAPVIRLNETGEVAETPCVCGCCRWVGGEIKPDFGSSPTDTDGQGGAVLSGTEPRP